MSVDGCVDSSRESDMIRLSLLKRVTEKLERVAVTQSPALLWVFDK